MPEAALVFVIPLGLILMGAVVSLGSVAALKATDSPFVKILADASALFRADGRLWLVPLALLFFFLALSASFLLFFPLLVALIVVLLGRATHAESLMVATFWIGLIAATVAGAVVVTVADSVLAEAFVEESRGEPCGFGRSARSVARRLPALIAFGMIVREGLGPIQALRRAAELARADFGGNLREVFALKAIDTGVMSGTMGVYVLSQFTVMTFSLTRDPALPSDPSALRKIIAIPLAAAIFVPVVYFVAVQTLQIIVAAASYLYVRDGVMIRGFAAEDFDRIVGLRPRSLCAVGLGNPAPTTS